MIHLVRTGLVAVALALLAACTGATIGGTGSTSVDRFHPDFARYVIASGPIPTEIRGNPSTLAVQDFQAITLRRLALEGGYAPHRFVLAPPPAPRHNFRVVLLFNPTDRAITEDAICRGEGGTYSQPQGEIYLRGAFCNRSDAYASGFVKAPVPAAFDSEAYSQFLAQLMFNMMPLRDPRAADITCDRPAC